MIPIYTYSTESGHLSTAAATVEAATAAPRPAETPTSNPRLLQCRAGTLEDHGISRYWSKKESSVGGHAVRGRTARVFLLHVV